MKRMLAISILFSLVIVAAFSGGNSVTIIPNEAVDGSTNQVNAQTSSALESGEENMKTIYFAGGCFWGVERLMSLVPGVKESQSGYANGEGENPTYEQVISGNTGYRETVKVTYDENIIGTKDLLRLFFGVIDPTVSNRQGNDVGSQYQTGVYWEDDEDEEVIRGAAEAEKMLHKEFQVEIEPLHSFWPAEEYHQDYLVKNPFGYCHIGPNDFEKARELVKE